MKILVGNKVDRVSCVEFIFYKLSQSYKIPKLSFSLLNVYHSMSSTAIHTLYKLLWFRVWKSNICHFGGSCSIYEVTLFIFSQLPPPSVTCYFTG